MSKYDKKGFLWDYKKKMATKKLNIFILLLIVSLLLLANIRLGIVTLGMHLPFIIILPGMVFLYLISAIVIAVLFGRIDEVRKDNLNYQFSDICILVAEQNFVNRDIFTAILSHTGIKIDFAQKGEELLSLFNNNQFKYKMIFIDVDMSGMDTCDLFRVIRGSKVKDAENIPIIGIIGQTAKGNIEEYFSAGMDDAIARPFDPEDVCILIQKRTANQYKE